jgi:dipeptidyl aminopeptidase/acylaminoacyl peptidase
VTLLSRVSVETGFPYTKSEEISLAAFEKMKKCSPCSYASDVVAPTLLLLGSKDKRVPSNQGIHYYYILKAHNIKSKYVDYFYTFICSLETG